MLTAQSTGIVNARSRSAILRNFVRQFRIAGSRRQRRVLGGGWSWMICGLLLVTLTSITNAQTYRFVFLGPKSAVLIEAKITSGNWDVREIRQQYAAGVFQRLDADNDGMLNETEATQIPKSGRFSAAGERLGNSWSLLDAMPQDGQVSESELFTFLDQLLGPPLTIEKAAPRLAETVRLYAELDLDEDGRITPQEFRDGLTRLQLSDFDDDETLSVAELQPYPIAVVQAQQAAAAAEQKEELPLLLATSESDRLAAAVRIIEQYGTDAALTSPQRLGVPERFFKAFDVDRNGSLNAAEVAAYLAKVPAQLKLLVSLGPPFVSTEDLHPLATDIVVLKQGKRPEFDLAGVPVECFAFNRSADLSDQVGLYKTRAISGDRDNNGYLDQGEFATLQAPETRFEDVDLDGNSQVTRDEIDTFFKLDGLAAQCRLVATISDEAKVLFNLLDSATDNRLSIREMRAAENVLGQYDVDGDGALAEEELATRLRITFSQPVLVDHRPGATMNATSRAGVTRQDSSGPLWFRRMDRNLDNDLSWREFLGSKADFDEVDTDHDGLITLEEAERAETQRGK